MDGSEVKKGFAAISLGSILLGSIGVFVRFASSSIQPMTQTFGRIFFAFFLISLVNLIRGKIRTDVFTIQKRHLTYFFLNGLVGFSLMASAFTLAVLHTSITNTYFLLYTAPVFAAILGAVFLKEKINRSVLLTILISFAGLVLLFNPSGLTQNLVGNGFGLLTGVCFGSYFVITSYLGRTYTSATITFWTQLFGSLGLFPLIFMFDKPGGFSFVLGEWSPVLAAGGVVLSGYLLLNYGLRRIPASVGSILSLFEPLSSLGYGLIFFAEKPSYSTLFGAGLIVLGIIYLATHQTNTLVRTPLRTFLKTISPEGENSTSLKIPPRRWNR